jgi:aminoglycoside/choline kinase family phosphotransferase
VRENEVFQDERYLELIQWLDSDTRFGGMPLETASADASFRRYFRISGKGETWIAMDAPIEKEDSEPFVRIAGYLRGGGVRVPEIIQYDLSKGFMVIEDFGGCHFEDALADGADRDYLYGMALEAMVPITTLPDEVARLLPPFDQAWLTKELMIFHEWFLGEGELSQGEWKEQISPILEGILEQPKVFVHRDFHGRNLLMLKESTEIGIIDFQGALFGPLTYDLGSLLKDCYQDNSIHWIYDKALQQKSAYERAFNVQWDDNLFLKWMDWTGLQRHLKVLGLFRRLFVRDGKDRYLNDLPRVWNYANDVLQNYSELKSLKVWLEKFDVWNSYQL